MCITEQLLEFMQQLPAFANLSVWVRRELCAVMVFAVVERAGTVVLNHGEEVRFSYPVSPALEPDWLGVDLSVSVCVQGAQCVFVSVVARHLGKEV